MGTRRGDILVPLFVAVAFAGPRWGRSWADWRGDFQSPRGSGGRKTPTPFLAGFRRTGAGGGASKTDCPLLKGEIDSPAGCGDDRVSSGGLLGTCRKIAGLRWVREHPNQLYRTPLREPTRTLEEGMPGSAKKAGWRLASPSATPRDSRGQSPTSTRISRRRSAPGRKDGTRTLPQPGIRPGRRASGRWPSSTPPPGPAGTEAHGSSRN